jgi:hypothetical protein
VDESQKGGTRAANQPFSVVLQGPREEGGAIPERMQRQGGPGMVTGAERQKDSRFLRHGRGGREKQGREKKGRGDGAGLSEAG